MYHGGLKGFTVQMYPAAEGSPSAFFGGSVPPSTVAVDSRIGLSLAARTSSNDDALPGAALGAVLAAAVVVLLCLAALSVFVHRHLHKQAHVKQDVTHQDQKVCSETRT